MKARIRTALLRTVIVAELVALAGTAAPVGAQPDVDALIAVVDDPTWLAQQIDERVATALQECMNGAGFAYEVADDAQFDLAPVEDVQPAVFEFEAPLRNLIPVVIDPDLISTEFLELEPAPTAPPVREFAPPTLQPSIVDPGLVVAGDLLEVTEVAVTGPDPDLIDLSIRLDPVTEGYGIALDAFDVVETNPNRDIVEDLSLAEVTAYETALYGTPLRVITDTTEPGGCSLVVEDLLRDIVVPGLEAAQIEMERLAATIDEAPDYRTALSQWSECIAEAGPATDLELTTPQDAEALIAFRYAGLTAIAASDLTELRTFETELAAADHTCRAQTTDLAITSVLFQDAGDYVTAVVQAGTTIEEAGS